MKFLGALILRFQDLQIVSGSVVNIFKRRSLSAVSVFLMFLLINMVKSFISDMVAAEDRDHFLSHIVKTICDSAADFDISIQKEAACFVEKSRLVICTGTEIAGCSENNKKNTGKDKNITYHFQHDHRPPLRVIIIERTSIIDIFILTLIS